MTHILKQLLGLRYFNKNINEAEQEKTHLYERAFINALMDNVPDHIYCKDMDSKFIRINKALSEYFKLRNPEQAVGKTDFDFFSEEHAQQAFDDEQSVIKTGKSLYKEEKETWNDHSDSWVSTVKLPLRNEKGKIIGTFGISRDITHRIIAEYTLKEKNEEIKTQNEYYLQMNEELQQTLEELSNAHAKVEESEERYRRIVDGITDYLYTVRIKDGKAIETHHSEACVAITGYSSKEFESDPELWFNMVVPEDRELVSGSFAKLLEGEDIYSIEHRIIHKNGSTHWISYTIIPKYDSIGSLMSYDGIIKDITERKQAMEAVAKERNLLQTLIDNLPSAVFVKDKDYRKVIANKLHLSSMAAHLSSLGMDPDTDIIGKTDFEITSKELAEKYYIDDQAVIRDGLSIINKEEEGFDPDGKKIWLLVSKIPIRDKNGIINGMLAITTDITEHKEAELMLIDKTQIIEAQNEEFQQINEELQQMNDELILAKEKAEESNRLKTAFLQNMSHEIRTPMNSIIGFAEMLKNPELSGEKQKEFISVIEQGGQRMISIINDIIDISKIESGQIEISSNEINVNILLKQLHAFFKSEAEEKGLNLICKTECADELCEIETDETKLTQVLSNLLKNSLKFTKKGEISFGYYIKKNEIEFYVQDSGKGIPESHKEIIFDRFVQGEMSNTRDYEGAGLGLSISKAFVEKLGGRLWFESEVDKGTTFYFNIPYKVVKAGQIKPLLKSSLKENLQPLNILIAEDDKYSMLLMQNIFKLEKANLFIANNGEEALNMVKLHPEIQIVLMDIKMPVMDGYEAIKLIKELRPDLPIIAQSAYAFSYDKEKAKKAGFVDFICKPMKIESLLSVINKQLSMI
jgi:PAS domain S-box-containing protein